MVLPSWFHGGVCASISSTVLPRDFHGASKGISWYFHGTFVVLPRCSQRTSKVLSRWCSHFHCFHGASMESTSIALPLRFHGHFRGVSMVLDALPWWRVQFRWIYDVSVGRLWRFDRGLRVLPVCFHGGVCASRIHVSSMGSPRLFQRRFKVIPWCFHRYSTVLS